MVSQYFIRFRAIALMIMPVGFNCGFEFKKLGISLEMPKNWVE